MSVNLQYRRAGESDLAELAKLLSVSFGVAESDERDWIRRAGADARVLGDDAGIAAGLLLLEGMALYSGGRRIPCAGVAGVCTDPTRRGSGAGTALMRACVTELHERSVPLAALYPATQPVYRRAGFERAASRYRLTIPIGLLQLRDRDLPVRASLPADRPSLEALYERVCRREGNGNGRNEAMWDRIFASSIDDRRTFVVEEAGQPVGFVTLVLVTAGPKSTLTVFEFCAETPAAATRLLTFVGDHGSMADEAIFYGAPSEPAYALLREQKYEAMLRNHPMVRVVHVEGALSSRGYPRALNAELQLRIFDEILPENRGDWILSVSDGVGRLRRGGEGRLKLHVRALASLFTGFQSAQQLALTGLLEGGEEEMSVASAIFAGPQPYFRDHF